MAKLELLPADAPYARPSNAQLPITVSNLELRLPVLEQPGSLGGLVSSPAPKVLPPGYELAAEYRGIGDATPGGGTKAVAARRGIAGLAGKIRATHRRLIVPLRCRGGGACKGRLKMTVRHRTAHRRLLAKGSYSIAAGKTVRLRLPLTKAARRLIASQATRRGGRPGKLKGRLQLDDSGRPTRLMLSRAVRLPRSD